MLSNFVANVATDSATNAVPKMLYSSIAMATVLSSVVAKELLIHEHFSNRKNNKSNDQIFKISITIS